MKIVKKTRNYSYVGTQERHTRISNTLLSNLKSPTMLPCPDKTWAHPRKEYKNTIILSNGNSKVKAFASRIQTKGVAFGKSAILSCPFASSCIRFCYQNLINYTASNRLHGHNYLKVYSNKRSEIRTYIINGIALLPKTVELVRLNDAGDFISLDEILAWIDVSVLYPHIVFYGYTKNTPHLHKARQVFGQFPSNFRISISDTNENDSTMADYMDRIRTEFPNEFYICHIIDSEDRDDLYQSLPWNDGELQAYDYNSDFKIALHVGSAQRQFCNDGELSVNDKYKDVDGVC